MFDMFSQGWTALMHAVAGSHDNIVSLLLASGADTRVKDKVSRYLVDIGEFDVSS